jgi:hypothetical protein
MSATPKISIAALRHGSSDVRTGRPHDACSPGRSSANPLRAPSGLQFMTRQGSAPTSPRLRGSCWFVLSARIGGNRAIHELHCL